MINEIASEPLIEESMDDLDDQENSAGLDQQLDLLEKEQEMTTLVVTVKRLRGETSRQGQTGASNQLFANFIPQTL